MTLIVCVEDRFGMSFHNRRLSRDRELCRYILARVGGGVLRLSPYSVPLFDGLPCAGALLAQEGGPADEDREEFCFLELENPAPWLARAEKLLLYRWNRAYPFDRRFPAELLETGWKLTGHADFPGSSHEKITEERYETA